MGFFDSEMERSFLKTAKKKGWVKDDPQIVRTASVEKIASTGNVDVDICLLIDGLRKRGHEKQAKNLEASYMAYKQAASELYNVHNEDGPSFLEMAHPEGDQKVENAQDGHGDVETLLSAHNKIREIALKEPKKKSIAKLASVIIKEAKGINDLDSFISGFTFNIDMPMLINMVEKNSGPFYDFINIYYNELFNAAFKYKAAVELVYGADSFRTKTEPQSFMIINHGLNSNPTEYLTKVQHNTSINALRYMGDTAAANWWDWFWSKRSEIANSIDKEFKSQYSSIYNKIDSVNKSINLKFQEVARTLKSLSGDPLKFYNYLENIASNGTYKFIHNAINAFYDERYTTALAEVAQTSTSAAREAIEQEDESAPEVVQPTQAPNDAKALFMQASQLLMSEMKNPNDTAIAQENAGIVYQLAAAVNSGNIDTIKRVFSQKGITVNSMKDVEQVAKQWIDWAKGKAKV